MATPCRRCGAEKTEKAHPGLLSSLAKAMGYRLLVCSRCRRLRLLPRVSPPAEEALAPDPTPQRPVKGVCPKCGKADYRRSRRHFWEHLLFRGPMARCRSCRARFPLPRLIEPA